MAISFSNLRIQSECLNGSGGIPHVLHETQLIRPVDETGTLNLRGEEEKRIENPWLD